LRSDARAGCSRWSRRARAGGRALSAPRTPFNAPNYVKTIKRLLDKSDADSIFNTGPVESFIDDTYGEVASYSATDDNTVVFKFKEVSGPFTTNLAMVRNGVVSPTAVTKFGKDFRNHPVGTGPFIFKEYRQGDQVILDANPNYWGGKPQVDRIVFKIVPDAQAALLAIKRGDVHILADVSVQTVCVSSSPRVVPRIPSVQLCATLCFNFGCRHSWAP